MAAKSRVLSLDGRTGILNWSCIVGQKLVEMGQNDGAKLGDQHLELKYEELTTNPRKEMGRVCDFLNLEFAE